MAALNGSKTEYSVLDERRDQLQKALQRNSQTAGLLPSNAIELARHISFTGHDRPSIPVNWRFAESITVLKAFEGIMINAFVKARYNLDPQDIVIDVNHAQLFIASCLLTRIEVPGQDAIASGQSGFSTKSVFPSCDIYRNSATPYRTCAGNIYKTKDEKWFHLHSDLNPDVVQDALGLPHDVEGDYDDVYSVYQDETTQFTAAELDRLADEKLKTSGTVVMSTEEYAATEHGRANTETKLWEIEKYNLPGSENKQKPCWWPLTPQTSPQRPLAGVKVVDFSRIIAAPTATRGLAEYGASIMRVTSSHLPDMGFLHPDMGWGKWNCSLDFRKSEDVEKARDLIRDADVVVYGYRPQVLDKYGLGVDDVMKLCKDRERGLIVLRLNCYGWVGPWSHRTGWQQISDACCGVSLEYGRALHGGKADEPVTPVFPNSDHCAGLAGTLGVVSALMKRAKEGGSYLVSCSLNAYSQWLTREIGTYPQDVWNEVWELHGSPKFRHYHPMQYLFPRGIQLIRENTPHMMEEKYFEMRNADAMGCRIECVKPVLHFSGRKIRPGFQVSARTNGVDRAEWPEDLMVDKV